MTPKDFWKAYAGDVAPGDFMCRYRSRNPRRCAERHVSRLPAFLGIARRETWKATFAAPRQYSRDEVIAGLTAYLEETRQEWEPVVAARDAQERIECDQEEWERAEQQRLNQEQAEWERAHAPESAASSPSAPSGEPKLQFEISPESAVKDVVTPLPQESASVDVEDAAAAMDAVAAAPNESSGEGAASGG